MFWKCCLYIRVYVRDPSFHALRHGSDPMRIEVQCVLEFSFSFFLSILAAFGVCLQLAVNIDFFRCIVI